MQWVVLKFHRLYFEKIVVMIFKTIRRVLAKFLRLYFDKIFIMIFNTRFHETAVAYQPDNVIG